MKLHLPKQLFTALLTAITLAAPAAVTLGSSAWGADVTINTNTTWADSGQSVGASDKIFVGIEGTSEIKLTIADGDAISCDWIALRGGGDVEMTGGSLTVNRLHIHNYNRYSGQEFFELKGGEVTVNGSDDFGNSATGLKAAITIGHWGGGSGKLKVSGGTLNSLNGSIYMGYDSSAELEITGGTVNVKGFYYRSDVGRTSSISLNGGRLNIGTQGINNSNIGNIANTTVTLTSGKLGALDAAGWTLQNVKTTIGNITIDTDVWDAAAGATATGDAAGSANISLLGDLVAESADSSITLSGSGSLTIDHTWDGTLNLANDATAKVLINTGDMSGFDAVLSGEYGDTQASGFAAYQIFNSGSTASVYSTTDKDNALALTAGAYSTSDFHVHDTVNYSTITETVSRFYVQQGGKLVFSDMSTVPVPVANAAQVELNSGGATVTLQNLFGANAITQTAAGTTSIISSGTINLGAALTTSGKLAIAGAGTTEKATFNASATLEVGTLELENTTAAFNATSKESLKSNITLNSGATFTITGEDRVHYDGAPQYTWTVNEGATLNLGTASQAYRQTLARNFSLVLAGGVVNGKSDGNGSLDYYAGDANNAAGTIRVTSNSILNAAVRARSHKVILQVEGDGTVLTMGSSDGVNNFAAFTGAGSFEKSGAGTLLYQGAAFAHALTISAGVFEYNTDATREHSGSISGTGTFKKSGSGTLTLTNSSVPNLNVAGGKLVYQLADDAEAAVDHTLSSLVVSSGATFEKSGAGTLNAGALTAAILEGGIEVSEGVLQYNGISSENVGNPPKFVQLLQNLTTTGTGKVQIDGPVSFNWSHPSGTPAPVRKVVIDDNINVTGNLQINSYTSANDSDGDPVARWEVVEGGNLDVDGLLWLTNKQKLVVDGGSVTVDGGLKLGHGENGSVTYGNTLYSKLGVESGSLSTTGLTFVGGANSVCMTGGTLTFTPATDGGEVLIDGTTASDSAGAGTLDFTGGTLAATTAGWTLTGTDAMAVSLGNVEFDIAAGKTVTLAGIYNLTGTLGLTGNTVTEGETTTTGTMALTGTMNIGAIEVLKEQNVSYTAGDNGFAVGAFYLVENKDSANITTTGLTVNLAGTSVAASDITLSETGNHLLLSYSGKDVYYVNSGTEEATDTIGSTTGFDHYYVAQEATLSITQSEASLSDSNAKSALLSATGSGTIVYANAANETLICGTGMSDQFTGTLDLSQGTIYVGNTAGASVLNNSGGDTNFDASKVIVRADGAFWTHLGGGSAESGKIFAADFDLMNGAELNNRDGHVHYTGDIRFNVENPAAADSGFSSNGVVSLRQYWGKTLEYSGLLSGDGTVQMYATTASTSDGASDTKAFYKLSGADNTFRGTYELVNSTDSVPRTTTLILADATAAQYATVKLSSTDSLAVLQLNQDATIKGLYSADADNKVTTTAAATLTVSEGDFAGKLENGSATNILSLKKTGTGTLTLNGTNSYTGTTTVEGGELIISSAASLGSGNMTVNQGGTLTLDVKGALTFGTASRVSGAGTLKIAGGTTLTMTPTNGATAVVGSTIAVAAGGRLILDGNDRLSWNGSNPTGAIVLTGEADGETPKYATLELGGRQTQTTDIEMKGYAQIVKTTGASGSLNPYKYNGASLTVEGQHNTVSANLEMRDALLVNVKENGKLEVSGAVSMHTGGAVGTAADTGYETSSVVKLGAGDLEFSNDSNNFARKYVNQAGKTLISGNASFSNGVSVTGGTFEVNSVATINGAVSNSSNLAVSGGTTTFNGAVSNSSNLTVSGGTATFNGAVTNTAASSVTAGTASFAGGLELGGTGTSLTVSGGRADVTGALTVSGTEVCLSQSGEGVLNLSGGITVNAEAGATFNGAVGIGSTITNNGTLTLNDSITIIGELANFDARREAVQSYKLQDGTDGGSNGFLHIEGASYWLTDAEGTGTTTVGSGITTVTHGDASYALNQDNGEEGEGTTNNWYFNVESNTGKTYHIADGDVVVDSAVQAAATGGYVLSGGNMQLTGGTVNTASMSYSAGTITMTDGATLNVDSTLVTDDTNNTALLTTVLKGSGDVRFNSGFEITENLTSGFSGNLIVQNGAILTLGGEKEHDLSGFSGVVLEDGAILKLAYGTGVSAGTITLNEGTKLHLLNGNGANKTVNATLLVNGNATLQGGYFGDASVVDGFISGQGTLTVTRDLTNSFALDSDISDAVDGTLKLAFDNITAETGKQVTLSGSNTYTGGTTLTGGNLKTTSVNALGKGSVQVNEGGRLMVAENLKLEDSLQICGSGTTEVAAGKSLNLQDKVSLSSTNGTAAATLAAHGNAALAQMQEDASFTIQDMTLTNTTITAATPGTQVNFSNVEVEGAVVLRNLQAAMTNASVGMGGQDGARTYTATTSLLSGITLNNTDVAGSTITVDLGDLAYTAPMGPSGKYDLTITLSGFTMQNYTQGIVFAADSWLGQLLSQPENADVQVSFSSVEAAAAAAESGAATGVTFSSGSVGTVITITGLNVPEPATSALSLLALAALAARRRRK